MPSFLFRHCGWHLMAIGLGLLWGNTTVLRSDVGPWHLLAQLRIECQALQKATLSVVKRGTRLERQMGALQLFLESPFSEAQSKFDIDERDLRQIQKEEMDLVSYLSGR